MVVSVITITCDKQISVHFAFNCMRQNVAANAAIAATQPQRWPSESYHINILLNCQLCPRLDIYDCGLVVPSGGTAIL